MLIPHGRSNTCPTYVPHPLVLNSNHFKIGHLLCFTLYLCKQKFSLHRHNDGYNNFNKGNYHQILNCFAEIDIVFFNKLYGKERTKQISGVLSKIKNNMQIISKAINDEIRIKVEKALFLLV